MDSPSKLSSSKWVLLIFLLLVFLVLGVLVEFFYQSVKPKEWPSYTVSNSDLTGFVVAIQIDGEDRVWFATSCCGLTVLSKDGKWQTYTTANSDLLSDRILSLDIDSTNKVWIGTAEGLNALDPDSSWFSHPTFQFPGSPSGRRSTAVRALAVDGQDNIWIGTNSGLHKLSPHDEQANLIYVPTHMIQEDLDPSNPDDMEELAPRVTSISVDPQGRLWVGTANYGLLVQSTDGTWANFHSRHLPWPDMIELELEDGRFLVTSFTDAIAFDKKGEVWLGTPNGVYNLKSSRQSTLFTQQNSGLPQDGVSSLLIDRRGRVWIGTNRGLSIIDPDGSWATYTPDNSGLLNARVFLLAQDSQSRMWIGTIQGVSVVEADTELPRRVPSILVGLHRIIMTPIQKAKAFYLDYRDYPIVLLSPILGMGIIIRVGWNVTKIIRNRKIKLARAIETLFLIAVLVALAIIYVIVTLYIALQETVLLFVRTT